MKRRKKGDSTEPKIGLRNAVILSGWGICVVICGISLASVFGHSTHIIATLLLLFWISFSFVIFRLKLGKDDLYSALSKDAKTYLPFLLFPVAYKIPSLFWQHILFILITAVFFFLKASLFKQKDLSQKLTISLLLFITLLYIVHYSFLSIIQYNGLFTGHLDLAVFDQAIWNTVCGRILHTDLYGYNFLGEHMSPILILLSPFYLIMQDPRMLLLLQSLFLGLGAIPVYLIAKDRLKHNLLSLSFSFAYLLHPFLSRINLFEFHAISLAPFFLLFCFYFLIKERWALYYIFLFLSLLIKEDVSLIIAALGIYTFFKINKKAGVITLLIGMLWAYLSVCVLIPYIRETAGVEAKYGHFGRYTLGSTPSEIIKNLVSNPQNTSKMLILPMNEKAGTLVLLILPTGFLSILSPAILISLPEIILHFLAPWTSQYLLLWQYPAPILPFIVVSGIYGCWRILRKHKSLSNAFGLYIFVISILSNHHFSTPAFNEIEHRSLLIPSYNPRNHAFFSFPKEKVKIYYQTQEERERFGVLKRLIPKDAPVSVQDNLLAHFSHRERLYAFPDFEEADYVLFNTYGFKEFGGGIWEDADKSREGLELLNTDPRFFLFFKEEGKMALFVKKEKKDEVVENFRRLSEADKNLLTRRDSFR
jgi:uncharacterized membrane protein